VTVTNLLKTLAFQFTVERESTLTLKSILIRFSLPAYGCVRQALLRAPIRLFESMADADAFAAQLPKDGQPNGVQFLLDASGNVVTARKKEPQPRRKR
jgi:hypothetical protein